MSRRISAWGLVLVWVALIFRMTFKVGTESAELSMGFVHFFDTFLRFINISVNIDTLHLIVRKSAHITVYFFLGIWTINALTYHALEFKEILIIGFFFTLVIASLDETFQLFVEGRHGALMDVMFDMIGAVSGGALIFYLKWKMKLI